MLITGGSGFLGRHLTDGHASDRWEFIAPSSRSLDIRNRDSTIDQITDWKPTAVVHLAYRKGDRPSIVDGSRHVAEAAAAIGARLVHMSSDMVYGGQLSDYVETDPTRPVTDYGRDKLDAETAVVEACPTAVLVRCSLLFGTAELSQAQLDVQRALSMGPDFHPMKFFTDEFRCPAHAADVANALGVLAARSDIAGPLHVAGPDVVSRAEFAEIVARWMGLDHSQLDTTSLQRASTFRPSRVVLDTSLAASYGIRCRPISATMR